MALALSRMPLIIPALSPGHRDAISSVKKRQPRITWGKLLLGLHVYRRENLKERTSFSCLLPSFISTFSAFISFYFLFLSLFPSSFSLQFVLFFIAPFSRTRCVAVRE
jgi:hypothetical protein